jgi:elongation factor G
MGELHLDIVADRLRREFQVIGNIGRPQVAYRETIRGTATAEGTHIRQTGGRGQYGKVTLRVSPRERGTGILFVDSTKGGPIPAEFLPAIESGVMEAATAGPLAGFPLMDLEVALIDGQTHDVDSSEIAFKIAGAEALRKAVTAAKLVLLEPIMRAEVICSEERMGDVLGDLNGRRAHVTGIAASPGHAETIHVTIPLAGTFGYATALRNITQGRGTYTMEPSHYAEVPDDIARTVIPGNYAVRAA